MKLATFQNLHVQDVHGDEHLALGALAAKWDGSCLLKLRQGIYFPEIKHGLRKCRAATSCWRANTAQEGRASCSRGL